MSFISAFEPHHLEDRATEERRGKVHPRFKPISRCLPFAVHLGFWDKSCPQHHDCCLPGLRRKRGGGWKSGERSLEDGHREPLSSTERKKQQIKWSPVAYLKAAFAETTGPGILSFHTSLNFIAKVSNLALYVSPTAPNHSVALKYPQHRVSTFPQDKCSRLHSQVLFPSANLSSTNLAMSFSLYALYILPPYPFSHECPFPDSPF